MTAIEQSSHPVKWISVKNLSVIWANAQREFKRTRSDKIAAEFDPDYFGTIAVTLPNGHGVYHIVDGQHRVAAVRGMWGEAEQVPCLVLNAEDPERAAQIFAGMNSGRNDPTTLEEFKVAVTGGAPSEIAVNDLLTGMSYIIQPASEDGTVSCVGTCLFIYHKYGLQTLRKTFLVIQGVWGKTADSTNASIVRGIGNLLAEHLHIDEQRLVDKTQKYSPHQLIGAAKNIKEYRGGSISTNITRVLVETYNEKLRKGRLGDTAA